MAESSQQPIEQLFACLSHELRTPITSLQGAIALLQNHNLNDVSEVGSLLNLASESTDRLTQIIENILDWYQISQGSKSLFKQPCNITFILLQLIDSLNSLTTDKGIQIHLESPTEITLQADHYYLTRALSHLLQNAIKFSPSGGQISVTAALVEDRTILDVPSLLKIAVQDQGAGIPESALEEIFQPFYQLDTSDTRHHGGLGLELAICREIIQQHQGRIWAESTLGQGTTFCVILPILNYST
ncbi:MAG: sensor histidine kinase [Elainellaceae cyanobacterium]